MKIVIENVTKTSPEENQEVISRLNLKLSGLTRLEEAFNEVKKVIDPIMCFKAGRGGSHIWVSNYANERLLLITETRQHS